MLSGMLDQSPDRLAGVPTRTLTFPEPGLSILLKVGRQGKVNTCSTGLCSLPFPFPPPLAIGAKIWNVLVLLYLCLQSGHHVEERLQFPVHLVLRCQKLI